MIIQDSRKGNNTQPFSDFSRGTLLIKEIDPNNFFIKTDEPMKEMRFILTMESFSS